MAKYNCGQCGQRHRPGECPMQGYRRGDSSWLGRRRRARAEPETPACFPHKWVWSPWTRISRQMHERNKYCSKCNTPKPGSRIIERHHFRLGVCKECGELGQKNVDY